MLGPVHWQGSSIGFGRLLSKSCRRPSAGVPRGRGGPSDMGCLATRETQRAHDSWPAISCMRGPLGHVDWSVLRRSSPISLPRYPDYGTNASPDQVWQRWAAVWCAQSLGVHLERRAGKDATEAFFQGVAAVLSGAEFDVPEGESASKVGRSALRCAMAMWFIQNVSQRTVTTPFLGATKALLREVFDS
ncbi:hypothetical protein VTK73DRAFT_9784 [Phialemonium thermophilum]|uniref:Tetracyclin repressor-like C-terminal domain-containing protein n=1 Tax=Phialemonium thermophilum TaxID=223376 RepID=A0ABR3W0E5_9PEZI